jgi:hypothetical protein
MRLNKLIRVLPILFLLIPLIPVINSQQGIGFIIIPHISQLIAPGMSEVPITLTITYTGSMYAYNVNITPITSFPIKPYTYYNNTGTVTVPELTQGQSINVTFLYNVFPNASDGVYKVYVNITGFLSNGAKFSEKIPFTLPILGYVSISASSVWGSPSSPLVVGPGENNLPLTIILVNEGNVIANNVTITFNKESYPLKFEQDEISIGYLPIGEPIEVVGYASIYPNASSGVYQIPIQVNYFNGNKMTVNLTVAINGYLNFSITSLWGSPSSPITVSAGESQVPLTFVIRNLGDVNALNVSLLIPNQYPLMVTQRQAYVGIIPAGEINYVTLTVSVYPNATPGVYYIPVTLYYFSGISMKEYVPIEIFPSNLTINMLTLPPQVYPGYFDVKVIALVLNYGSAIANNATITLSSSLPIVSAASFSIGAVPVGKVINVTFLINIPNSTKPGNYSLTFTLKYDGGEVKKAFTLTVYPKADLQIVAVYYPTINPGSTKVPITITVKNVGNVTAENVKAILGSSDVIYPHVSSSNPLMGLTASEAYIGDLKPGQEVNITYIVDVSGGASVGNYTLTVTFIWNQTGALFPFVQNDNFRVQVSPTAFSDLLSQGIIFEVGTSKILVSWIDIIVGLVILIIIIIVGIRVATRRVNKK